MTQPPNKKTHAAILREEIDAGRMEIERDWRGSALSAFVAGLEVGFSVFVMGILLTLFAGHIAPPTLRVMLALAYSLGFLFVILGRSELFTEHTSLAALPVIAGEASVWSLLRQWSVIYGGNLVGASIFAAICAWLGPALGIISISSLDHIARDLVEHRSWVIFASAVLAGWLMGILSWLATASRDTTGQIIVIVLTSGVIGLGQLHHCIVGSVEVLAGLFAAGSVSVADFFRFLSLATLGNSVGGVVFVALLKHAHASRGERRARAPQKTQTARRKFLERVSRTTSQP